MSYARENVAPVELRDFGAKNGPAKKVANGHAAKNTEQMEASWVNQTRRFHFQWFWDDPTTNSCSKFVASEKIPLYWT
ncbi:MAG: hypothetical protein GY820_24100 [Gammaproteobacteria bacterium]|nr:hypothetical protein [Gammaproteobacteria bacterium]